MSKSAIVCAILLLAGFVTAPSATLADGAELYSKNCALCHGADGQKEAGPEKKTIAGRDAAAVKSGLESAKVHGPIRGKLSDEDLDAIAAAVAALGG